MWPALAYCLLGVVVMTVAGLLVSAGARASRLRTPVDRRPAYLATYNLGREGRP